MLNGTNLSDIASTIQSAIAPVFLLAAIGHIVTVVSTRLSRAVDRTRVLEGYHQASIGDEHMRHVSELRILDQRISLANSSITFCVASALAICLVIILLFVGAMLQRQIGDAVAALFVLAMLLFAIGIIYFMLEIRVAIQALRVRADLLEHDPVI